MVRTALQGFFHDIYTRVTAGCRRRSGAHWITSMSVAPVGPNRCLTSSYCSCRAWDEPLEEVCTTLQTLRATGVPADALADCRRKSSDAESGGGTTKMPGRCGRIRPLSATPCMACFIHVRTMEVTDDAVRMLLEIIRRMDTQTEKYLQKELLRDIKRVAGKVQLLYRVVEAVVEEPTAPSARSFFPKSKKRLFGSWRRKRSQWAPVPYLVSVCHATEVHPPLSALLPWVL